LINWYQQSTGGLKDDPLSAQPWAFGRFSNGTPINRAHRLVFRSRPDLQHRFSDPFAASQSNEDDDFEAWCRIKGSAEYPDLLPEPRKNADWSKVMGHLIPSLAPSDIDSPPLLARLQAATTDIRQARLLWQQSVRVLKREGFAGLTRRIRQAMR
jgi:hypothetical protein